MQHTSLVTRSAFCALTLTAVCAAAGCTSTPTAPSTWSPDRLREQILISNLNNLQFGSSGRLTRWRVPIEANTNGIGRAETALAHYEQWTGGVVRFTRVGQAPLNGITFREGGAGGSDVSDACGSVGQPFTYAWDASRAITGAYVIHLGADTCDDETAGAYPSAVAEHLIGHVLGVADHFDGYQHRTGLDDPRLLGVIYNLYANPLGATASELTVWGVR